MSERLGAQLQSGGLRQSIHTGLLGGGLFAGASLDLNFAATKNIGPLVTFTRASTGTYVGSNGVLQTAATDVPRFDHNPTTGESLGLLVEEQRTNLLLNSNTLSTQSVTVTTVAHTLSFYGTGTVTLTGASTAGPATGTGAFPTRTTLTFTPAAGALTLTVTGSVTSAQLEAGAFATSYIPTTTAAATRSADVASITGTNFSSWYRQDEGTVFAESRVQEFTVTNFSRIASLDRGDASANFAAIVRSSALNRVEYSVFVGTGQAVGLQPAITFAAESTLRSAFVYKTDDFIAAANGTLSPADTLGTVTTAVTTLGVGMQGNGGLPYNGTIRRLTYWPQRLANSTLQAITQ